MNLRELAVGAVPTSGPSDLLGAVPYLVGFHPGSSLVVICVHGLRQRTGMVMRLDLPDPAWHEHFMAEAVVRAEHQRPDGVVLVCYTDEPDDGDALPQHDLIRTLIDRFATSPVEVVDALLVRHRRWWSYLCEQPTCCPPDGTPVSDATKGAAGQVAADVALRGRTIFGSREELEASLRCPQASQAAARQSFDRVGERLGAQWRDDGREAVRGRTMAMVETALARYMAGECDLSDDEVARICLGVGDPLARDEVASLPVAEGAAWIALLTELARRSPDGVAAPICTTLAWVAYQHGEGALANVALERALADDPQYNLALILLDAIDRQVSPDAVRSVSSAVRSGAASAGKRTSAGAPSSSDASGQRRVAPERVERP